MCKRIWKIGCKNIEISHCILECFQNQFFSFLLSVDINPVAHFQISDGVSLHYYTARWQKTTNEVTRRKKAHMSDKPCLEEMFCTPISSYFSTTISVFFRYFVKMWKFYCFCREIGHRNDFKITVFIVFVLICRCCVLIFCYLGIKWLKKRSDVKVLIFVRGEMWKNREVFRRTSFWKDFGKGNFTTILFFTYFAWTSSFRK